MVNAKKHKRKNSSYNMEEEIQDLEINIIDVS